MGEVKREGQPEMKATFKVLVVALALVALGTRAWSEDSVEERLKRLEQIVQSQQQQLSERDAQIQRLTTAQNVASTIASMPTLADAPKKDDPNDMSIKWDKGLKITTKDKATSLTIGGRVQWQMGFVSEDEDWRNQLGQSSTATDGGQGEPDFVQLRRARLEMGGYFYKHVIWRLQLDYADSGDADIRDAWMGIKDIPYVGQWRVGNMTEPFDKEDIESSKYIQFVERSLINNFTPGRNFGMEFHNSHLDDRLQWSFGAFRETDDSCVIRSNSNYIGAARISGLPYWANEGNRHVHIGIAGRGATVGAIHDPADPEKHDFDPGAYPETIRFRARPSVRTAYRPLDTGSLSYIESDYRLSGELAFNWDSFNLDAQYVGIWLGADDERENYYYNNGSGTRLTRYGEDVFLWGATVQASYWLTGESRKYSKKEGIYGRVSPKKNFAIDGSGFGAVQLAARFSYLDFDSDGLTERTYAGDETSAVALHRDAPGTMWIATAGVNWHLNPNTRILANYNYAHVEKEYFDTTAPNLYRHRDLEVNQHAFVFMFQVDW